MNWGSVFFSPDLLARRAEGKKERKRKRKKERERESTQHDIPNSSWILWGLLLLVQFGKLGFFGAARGASLVGKAGNYKT
jgi:hypothetical protein